MKKTQLTQEGLKKLQEEYDDLVKNKRSYAVDRLQKARSMGDLSENSEYSAAKEELAFVEGRIQEIDEIFKNVEVVENHNHKLDVEVGTTVVLETNGERETYQIVGEFEADPMNKKLSNTSPIGKALIGNKVDDVVEVNVPAGKIKYKIVDIS